MSQNSVPSSVTAILNTIHKVEGFDPTPLAVEYMDLTTQEKRKRLPVMAQLAWFRLKYPEGKIAIDVEAVKDGFVYHIEEKDICYASNNIGNAVSAMYASVSETRGDE